MPNIGSAHTSAFWSGNGNGTFGHRARVPDRDRPERGHDRRRERRRPARSQFGRRRVGEHLHPPQHHADGPPGTAGRGRQRGRQRDPRGDQLRPGAELHPVDRAASTTPACSEPPSVPPTRSSPLAPRSSTPSPRTRPPRPHSHSAAPAARSGRLRATSNDRRSERQRDRRGELQQQLPLQHRRLRFPEHALPADLRPDAVQRAASSTRSASARTSQFNGAFTATVDLKINLSYSARTPNNASNFFADNVGTGVVTVFDGLDDASRASPVGQ